MADDTIATTGAVGGLDWWDDRDVPMSWDLLFLGGEQWPGICTIDGPGCTRKIDAQAEKGSDGATLKDEGYEPARFTISLQLTTRGQWEDLQRLLPAVHPRKKGGARFPTEICYPSVNLLGISQVYIDKIPIPQKPSAEDCVMVFQMSCVEWFPSPKPVTKGAAGGKKDSTTGPWPESEGNIRGPINPWDYVNNPFFRTGSPPADSTTVQENGAGKVPPTGGGWLG